MKIASFASALCLPAAVASLIGVGACAPTPMAPPPALAAEPEWALRPPSLGRTLRMQFGPYMVHRLEFGDVRQRGSVGDALVRGKQQFEQRYEFRLADTTGMRYLWVVRCNNRDYERGYQIGSVGLTLDQNMSLECTLNPPEDPSDPWSLRLFAQGDSTPAGEIRRGEVQYRLEGERKPNDDWVSRYSIWRDDQLVANVDRRGGSRLRVAGDVEDKGFMAAAATALLMQTNLIRD